MKLVVQLLANNSAHTPLQCAHRTPKRLDRTPQTTRPGSLSVCLHLTSLPGLGTANEVSSGCFFLGSNALNTAISIGSPTTNLRFTNRANRGRGSSSTLYRMLDDKFNSIASLLSTDSLHGCTIHIRRNWIIWFQNPFSWLCVENVACYVAFGDILVWLPMPVSIVNSHFHEEFLTPFPWAP